MKTLIKLLAIALLLGTTTSCFMDGIKGDRHVVSERRDISSDFMKIDANQGMEVYLTMGDQVSLTIEADENLHDLIITEVKDGTLHIYTKKNIWSSKSRKVYVTALTINEISVSSGAEVISENTIKSDDFKIRATSGSDVRLQLNVDNLNCSTTSGADARLKGKASTFTAKSTSGSDIKAQELETETCNVKVTSGADVYINVTQSLHANATSGGDIKYIGNPKNVQKDVSSSGSIRNKQNS
ncbi:MAG: head GIN domain-containing protein [Aureibaculum sp.]|nr:head GIN domain-containing protein [Aureibaculum sp.]